MITQILLNVQKGKIGEAEQIGLAHLVLSAATDAPATLLTRVCLGYCAGLHFLIVGTFASVPENVLDAMFPSSRCGHALVGGP